MRPSGSARAASWLGSLRRMDTNGRESVGPLSDLADAKGVLHVGHPLASEIHAPSRELYGVACRIIVPGDASFDNDCESCMAHGVTRTRIQRPDGKRTNRWSLASQGANSHFVERRMDARVGHVMIKPPSR